MKEQLTFGDVEFNGKKKKTRKEIFLAQMEHIVPIKECCALIEPHYYKAGNGTKPTNLETIFRMYLVRSWYNTSDPATEDMVYDVQSIRAFVGIDLLNENVPDESVLCRFRHLLEKHNLTEQIFNMMNKSLSEAGIICREGTIVDATLISAPSSTRNKDKSRDPEMSSTQKNNK